MSELLTTIYTDGACRGNPGLGAYGTILKYGEKERELSEVVENTTNNRMELLAVIRGLEALKRPCRAKVVTDSQYVFHGMTKWVKGWQKRGWRKANKEEVLNRDLWERLVEVAAQHDVQWEWVRGHAGHEFNERCDALANRAMDEFLAGRS